MSDRSGSPGPCMAKRLCVERVLVDAFDDMQLVHKLPLQELHATVRAAISSDDVLCDLTRRMVMAQEVPLPDRVRSLCMLATTAQLVTVALEWMEMSADYTEIQEVLAIMRAECSTASLEIGNLVRAVARDIGCSVALLALLDPMNAAHDEVRAFVVSNLPRKEPTWSQSLLRNVDAINAAIANLGMLDNPSPASAAIGDVLRAHAEECKINLAADEREIVKLQRRRDARNGELTRYNMAMINLTQETRRLVVDTDVLLS